MILVVGASGTIGSEVVRLLRAKGEKVRLTTSREPKEASAVKLNMATGEGLRAAFDGVDKVFLMSPPGYADHYSMLAPVIQESKRRGLKKVVLMTAMGANADASSPFRRAEIELEKSGLAYNIVRPNWFMQNFNSYWIRGIREQGKIIVPAGEAKVSFIDTRDISEVVATLLTTSKFDNRDFDITGPEAIDHHQVAGAISATTGRKIVYAENSPEELRADLLAAGFAPDYADFMLLIMGFLREGYSAGVTSGVRDVLGREARSIAQYAIDFKSQLV